MIGSTNEVSAVELTSPPMTTTASGRWASDPGPVANTMGIRLTIAMIAD